MCTGVALNAPFVTKETSDLLYPLPLGVTKMYSVVETFSEAISLKF